MAGGMAGRVVRRSIPKAQRPRARHVMTPVSTRSKATAEEEAVGDDPGQPIGATVLPGAGVRFRVWAPSPRSIELVLEGRPSGAVALKREPEGFFSATVKDAGPGTLFRYRVDGELLPDPASRFQPDGPCGPSEVI